MAGVGLALAATEAARAQQPPGTQHPAPSTHLLIVSGIGGEAQYSKAFHESALAMADAAVQRSGLPAANVVYLAEDPARDAKRIAGASTKANVEQALARIAERAGPDDQVVVLLIGHGSAQGEEARFNLPGPDLTAADLARALGRFGARRVALVGAASASGGFLKPLAGKNRVVITATKTGMERNESKFAGYFVRAYTGEGADTDHDGRVSLLEAFTYARVEVARDYEQRQHLLTEHAQLDDNGDGAGTAEPDPAKGEGDGALAAAFFLGNAVATVAGGPAVSLTPELARLVAQVNTLRQKKSSMPAEAYDTELEKLLVDIAQRSRAMRAGQGGRP